MGGNKKVPKYIDPKRAVSSYFSHLSMLENNASTLYNTVAEKTAVSSVQCLMQKIASDSRKHSSLLKGMSEKLVMPRATNIENVTEFGDAFKIIYVMQKDIEANNKIDEIELLVLSAKLAILEKVLNEKYSIVHDRISKIIARSAGTFQSSSLDSFNSFFERISQDEAEHQKILAGIEGLIGATEQTVTNVSMEVNISSPELSQKDLPLAESSVDQKGLK